MALTRAQIAALIAANLPDNVSKLITPVKHREVETGIAGSSPNTLDDLITVSLGAASAGKVPVTNGSGQLDDSFIPSGGGGVATIDTGNQVWVDAVFGNDSTGLVQRQDKPFLTVTAAVAAITDASTSKRYVVKIAPGNYASEGRDIFKSWVFLHGAPTGGFDNETVHLQTSGGGSFKIPIEAGTGTTIFGASGISFDSYVNFTLANTRVLQGIFKNCTFVSGMENQHTGGANFISFELYDCVFEDLFTQSGGYLISFNCWFGSDVALDIPQSCPSAFGTINRVIAVNSPCASAITLNMSATTGTHLITFNGSPNFGLTTSNTGGNTVGNTRLNLDSVSIPGIGLFSNTGWTVTRVSSGLVVDNVGIVTQAGADIKTPNALGAFAIDVTKNWNTKSISADQTFTFSGTPATASTFFSLFVTNTDSSAHTLTIPSSFSLVQGGAITSIVIPASGKLALTWQYDGTGYNIFGDPVASTGTGPFVRSTNPTISGAWLLAENAGLQLDAALSADGKYCGVVEAGTAGATLAFGDSVYLAVADSRWELTDADAEATAGPVKIGICVLAAAADGDPTVILLWGKVRADAAFPTLTVGASVYVSTTAGDIQVAQPSGTDDVIRVIGFANTADELFFCPSSDYMTHV